jgi:Ca2+ regulator and membrane fusion protein Fig1
MAIGLAFLCVVLLSTLPGWHHEEDPHTGSDIDIRPFPSSSAVMTGLVTSLAAGFFAFASALWQHTGAVSARYMVQAMGYGSFVADTGTAALVLAWVSFGLLVVPAGGLVLWKIEIDALSTLGD